MTSEKATGSTHIDALVYQTLALGFLWAWILFMGNPSGLILGMSFDQSAPFRSLYQFGSAALLIALSFLPPLSSQTAFKLHTWAGAAGCIASCVLFKTGHVYGLGWALVISNILVAASYAILIRCWYWRSNLSMNETYMVVFAAGAVCLLAQIAPSVYGGTISMPLAIFCALACAFSLFRSLPSRTKTPPRPDHGVDRRILRMQFTAISLSTLVGSFLHFGIIGGDETWPYFSLVVSAGLALALAWRWKQPTPYLFVGIALFSCICTLLAAIGMRGVSSFVASTFWLLSTFGTAWAYGADRHSTRASGSLFLRALAVLQICSAIPKLVNTQALPDTTILLVGCTVVLAMCIVLYLVASFASPNETADSERPPVEDVVQASALNPIQSSLQDAYGLTTREYDVLLSLARGNSLKKTAETLALSEGAVKYHRHNLYVKLSVGSRQELIDLVDTFEKPV